MARIAINDEEWDAISGLPYIARCLYLELRRRMNYQTGIVGEKPRISRQALAEGLYVERGQGIRPDEAGSPTPSAIRWAIEKLKRAGLVEQMPADMQMIFRLVLADSESIRSKEVRPKYDRSTAEEVQPDETQHLQGKQQEEQPKYDRSTAEEVQPTSGYRLQDKPTTSSLCSEVEGPAKKSARAKKPDQPLPDPPGWVHLQAWAGFVEMRREIKHPLTPRSAELVIAELDTLRKQGHDPLRVLNASTMNRWRGVFPLKDQRTPQQSRQTSAQAATNSFLRPHHGQRNERDITGQAELLD